MSTEGAIERAGAISRALDAAREVLTSEGINVRCMVLSAGMAGGLRGGIYWPREELEAAIQLSRETEEALRMQARGDTEPLRSRP